ncbi:MAG TPA: hypothetical protein VG318_05005 [Actinomycetota bacterium]|nr:hypothetical protein [Actinomycetota bacterium]
MIKRSIAVLALVTAAVSFAGPAMANELVDTAATDKVACLFRVYIQEGGENGLECLT